jgi:4-diphosphocytidyl-2C-methyl-D-erythritol kinase
MSGSGPTVFGIYEEKDTAMKALDKIKEIEMVKDAYVVEPYQP